MLTDAYVHVLNKEGYRNTSGHSRWCLCKIYAHTYAHIYCLATGQREQVFCLHQQSEERVVTESCGSITSGFKKAFSDPSQMHAHCFRQGTWENELWLLAASGEGFTFCWRPNRDEPAQGVGLAHPASMWMLSRDLLFTRYWKLAALSSNEFQLHQLREKSAIKIAWGSQLLLHVI